MKASIILLCNILLIQISYSQSEPVLKIGLVADPQYAHKLSNNTRYYRESLWKLEEAVDTFNYYGVDFVQNLGDIIDDEWGSYDSILPIYDKLDPAIGVYHLLGNHDFSVDSSKLEYLLEKLSMPYYYYSYSDKGWRFIVLDATDYSYYSNLLHKRDSNEVDLYFEKAEEKPNNHTWNGAIGIEQQNWLKQELDSAKLLSQNVILYSHLPIEPPGNPHNLWNDYEILEILENSPHVIAFINGHNHAGGYIFQNGIHYITIAGMVEAKTNSYGLMEIYADRIVLKGFGNQKSIRLNTEELSPANANYRP